MEDPHSSAAAALNGSGNSRSTISSLLNDDASTDAQEVDFTSYGSPFLPDFGSSPSSGNPPDVIDVDRQPLNKKRRHSFDNNVDASAASASSFPSLHLHPLLGGASVENPQAQLPSPSLLAATAGQQQQQQQLDSHVVEEERRALAEERRKVAADRQQLSDERRAFEDEKRQFYDEKQKWLDERDKQTTTTGGGKPTISCVPFFLFPSASSGVARLTPLVDNKYCAPQLN